MYQPGSLEDPRIKKYMGMGYSRTETTIGLAFTQHASLNDSEVHGRKIVMGGGGDRASNGVQRVQRGGPFAPPHTSPHLPPSLPPPHT